MILQDALHKQWSTIIDRLSAARFESQANALDAILASAGMTIEDVAESVTPSSVAADDPAIPEKAPPQGATSAQKECGALAYFLYLIELLIGDPNALQTYCDRYAVCYDITS